MVQLRQKETKGVNTYVQVYQWCGCPLRGSVCGGCDFRKYVKGGFGRFFFFSVCGRRLPEIYFNALKRKNFARLLNKKQLKNFHKTS